MIQEKINISHDTQKIVLPSSYLEKENVVWIRRLQICSSVTLAGSRRLKSEGYLKGAALVSKNDIGMQFSQVSLKAPKISRKIVNNSEIPLLRSNRLHLPQFHNNSYFDIYQHVLVRPNPASNTADPEYKSFQATLCSSCEAVELGRKRNSADSGYRDLVGHFVTDDERYSTAQPPAGNTG